MYLLRKAQDFLLWRLQAYGTPSIKKFLWNAQFSEGRWNCLNTTLGDCVYAYVEKYARDGSILDLGCGSGNTGNELEAKAYRHYTGVDISDVAIETAKRRSEDNRRADKNVYFQSDILDYAPTQPHDVILFRDSLYYVPAAKIRAILERYSRCLTPAGVFIVRLYGGGGSKQNTILDIIERNFKIVEKHFSDEPKTVVVVFR